MSPATLQAAPIDHSGTCPISIPNSPFPIPHSREADGGIFRQRRIRPILYRVGGEPIGETKLARGIEPPAQGLQNPCSTVELRQLILFEGFGYSIQQIRGDQADFPDFLRRHIAGQAVKIHAQSRRVKERKSLP